MILSVIITTFCALVVHLSSALRVPNPGTLRFDYAGKNALPDYLGDETYQSDNKIYTNLLVNNTDPQAQYYHALLRRSYIQKRAERMHKRDLTLQKRKNAEEAEDVDVDVSFEELIKNDPRLQRLESAYDDGIPFEVKNLLYNTAWIGELSVGTKPEKFPVIFDTGSADFWISGAECSSCPSPRFNSQKSKTFKRTSQKFHISYGDGSFAHGYSGYDTVGLGDHSVQNQLVQIATRTSDSKDSGFNGILGLGFPTLATIKGTATLLDNLQRQGQIRNAMIGVQLKSRDLHKTTGGGGIFTFGGIDKSAIGSDFGYAPVISQYYWQIPIEKIRLGNVWSKKLSGGVVMDTGATLILLPDQIVDELYANVPGSIKIMGEWLCSCKIKDDDQYRGQRNLYFTFGGKDFGIPASTLAWIPITEELCYGAVQSGGDIGISIVGAAFLKETYAVFDQDNKIVAFANRTDLPQLTD